MPSTDQVTAVLVEPVTVAVNCCVCDVLREADVGEIETETLECVHETVIVATADLLPSATLTAANL